MRRAPHEPTSELGARALRSLRVLAQPRARMILTRYSPEGEPSVLPLFLGSALAVPAFLDDAGLHVGMPMERAALSESLEHQLAGEVVPPAEDRFLLSPALLETVEGLWCGSGRAFDQPIPRNVALAVLSHLPDCVGEPEDRLANLVGSPVASEDSAGIRFTAVARPWMERVLSGHSCELSFTGLEQGPGGPSRPQRLLFLGPPGRRILCSGVNGLDDLEAVLAQGQEPDVVPGPWTANHADPAEPTLVLSALPRPVLRWYLRRLLH